jgi:hypothetical protein
MNERKGFIGTMIEWSAHPFNTQGSALNWVLFVGLLIIAAWMWNTVLMRLTD